VEEIMVGKPKESARDLAAKGIVDGKKLQEWVDAPYGEFAKTVREKVDPFFGLQNEEDAPVRTYRVTIRYSYIPEPEVEYASKSYDVEAVSPEFAEQMAEELWDDDSDLETGEDHEITSISEPELLP
jgi:hypothetical protein